MRGTASPKPVAQVPALAQIIGEGIGLSVAIVDERGRIAYANPGFAGLVGRNATELVGRLFIDVIPQTEVAEARAIHDRILSGAGETARVVERQGQDGSRRLLLSRSTRFVDAEGVVWRVVAMTDVTDLKSLEHSADKTRSVLERYFEEAPDCFFIIRVEEDGRYVYEAQNPRSEAATGIPTAEFVGRTPTEVFSPETAAFVMRRYQECIEAGRTLQTVDHMMLHGRPSVWETVLIPVRDGTGRVVRINGISREITDVVASRRKLLSTERLLASILDVSDFGIAVVGTDFRLRAANRTLALFFGSDRDAMAGRDVRDLVAEQDRGRIEHMVSALLRAPMTRRELRVRTSAPLGERERILLVSGTAVEGDDEPLVAITAADVTRPTELEAALRRQEDRLLRIADEMPSAVAVLDRELRYEFVNRTTVQWYGREREHILGRTLWEILGRDRVSRILPHLERALAGVTVEFDDSHVYGDGVERVVHLAYSPRREADGRISGVYCFITDRTAARRAERDLLAAKEDAEAANRAKSQFLANMSHELRTPLNAIIGFSDLIMNETFGPIGSERYLEYARDIHTGGSHLLALINDMLDLARIEAGSYPIAPEEFDLARVVQQATTLVRVAAEQAGVEVVSEVPAGARTVVADIRALRQMLVNLLSNAVKFTPAGGRVVVSAERQERATLIRVTDTGEGIPADRLPVVTLPFASAHDVMTRAKDGTGIGLSIVKSLIERHGGSIDIDSSFGEGTRVTLVLPDRSDVGAEI